MSEAGWPNYNDVIITIIIY